ncbi:hypothetical protein GCG54_00000509 [Colletotrichum gloeosporioides]|uniref:PNPLA domain-containing protein n=1 Tax=Colletotrichum gloeosporioides TaxID=474922 RepID=A0A8H4CHL5_COLGL|nr:uncharacterized protein GCG54_00000509 [Colletotrichum gloeosporioides]KAF3804160.1 hypothetical protein GCG54_00000509 [Colletotrichum gloeosporioides]
MADVKVEAHHIDKNPTKFRNWSAAKDPGFNCKIWEAARATSAAPQLFKRIFIGEQLRQLEFVDGALGCNNPIQQVIEEALNEFEANRDVGCILSIGTGMRRAGTFGRPRGYQRLIPKDLIGVLAKMATDSNEAADRMSERFRNYDRLYYRLNAGPEVGDVGLDEWALLGQVEASTAGWLRNKTISRQIDGIVDALRGHSSEVLPLGSVSNAHSACISDGW